MKVIRSNINRLVKIRISGKRGSRNRWAQIVADNGETVMNTGQIKYIKSVAKRKYNIAIDRNV